jgi:hypothetical protein
MPRKRRARQVLPRSPLGSITLEEQLHHTRDVFMLLGDLLELQACAPDYMRSDLLGPAACRAATDLCRRNATILRELLDALPAPITSWSSGTSKRSTGR